MNGEEDKESEKQRFAEVWQATIDIWFGGMAAKPHRARIAKAVWAFMELGADAEQIRLRRQRHRDTWPNCECSPESLVKHWFRFAPRLVQSIALSKLDRVDVLSEEQTRMRFEEYRRRKQA